MAPIRPARSRARSGVRHRRHHLCDAGSRARAAWASTSRRAWSRSRARKRPRGPQPRFLVGDMMRLPFPRRDVRRRHDRLRHSQRAGDRARRWPSWLECLRPGGVLLSLDFDRPANALVRAVYLGYLTRRRLDARAGAARRSRYLSLHSRVHPALSGGRRRFAHRARAGIRRLRALSRPRRAHGHPSGGQIAHDFTHRQRAESPAFPREFLLPSIGSRFLRFRQSPASPAAVQPSIDESTTETPAQIKALLCPDRASGRVKPSFRTRPPSEAARLAARRNRSSRR